MPDSSSQTISKLPHWRKALSASADSERAKHFLNLLAATEGGAWLPKASTEQARILVALFAGSRALSDWLMSRPQFLEVFDPDALKFPRRKQGLRQELDQ